MRISEKVKNLRRKEQQFRDSGDLDRATHAKIIADFLEDYCAEQSGVSSATLGVGRVVIEVCGN